MKDLPIFDIILNEQDLEQGVSMISLVDEPAIGVDWIKLAKDNMMKLDFSADKEKKMLYGPFLIPNMLIYRRNEKLGEFYIRFKKEEIEKIAAKFNADLNAKNINFMHTDKKVEAFVAENWLIEDGADKSQKFGFELPEGTWFGGVKVKDDNFWTEMVKTDEVKGFSVEILADSQLALKNIENKMENKIKLSQIVAVDGTVVYFDGELNTGTAVFSDEAMTQPVSGEWTLENGDVVVAVDGVVTEVKKSEQSNDMPPIESDNAALTSQEVSLMIDARFSDLMNEITALKALIEPLMEKENDYKKQIEGLRAELNEKLSSTPATQSIKKEAIKSKLSSDFEREEERIRKFVGKN